MKTLLLGIVLIVIVGFGGLIYRNAVEHPLRPGTCPLDALVCPDGTSVARTGSSCTFPVCPPPNVTLASIGISFEIPNGFKDISTTEAIEYEMPAVSSTTEPADILIQRIPIEASSTALSVIKQTAIGLTSGMPVSPTLFSSTIIGTHRFTVVTVDRFEGNIDTAYYLTRGPDVIRFDAIDRGTDWTNPNLDIGTLPAHAALKRLLSTLQGG